MKVIDLLNKIANGEKPKFRFRERLFYYNDYYKYYGYDDKDGFFGTFNWFYLEELNDEVEIIEDTPKDDKIEKITLDDWVEFTNPGDINNIDYMFNKNSRTFVDKINEIIDKLEGGK